MKRKITVKVRWVGPVQSDLQRIADRTLAGKRAKVTVTRSPLAEMADRTVAQ